jgi:dTDP-4-dehydrorhamnose 3,5-epimerase
VTSLFFTKTSIEGLIIFEPRIFHDDRGYFFESFNANTWIEAGITRPFVQDNQARSTRGVLRGLHYQVGHDAQAKLVRVIEGAVLDVAVDLRHDSPTFGQHVAVELSAENKRQLYVPRGFAHGYIVLTDTAEFFYKCDNFYAKHAEGGLHYADPNLAIDWGMPASEFLVSEKDVILPFLGDHRVE